MAYYPMVAQLMVNRASCDVCKSTRRQTKRYRVARDADLVAVDLCRQDAEYIEKLIKLGERVPSTAPRVKLWTMEEIEKEGKRKNRP